MAKDNTANRSGASSGVRMFLLYLLFVALFLGVQMFQGFSWLDIGMYMSGYKHFNSDPYASCFLAQWILTYDFTGMLCRLFSIDSFMGLRVLHLIYMLVMQTVIYFSLRRYIPRKFIIGGLLVATLGHYGSYTEITYNDYSALLLTFSLLSFHKGTVDSRPWLVCLSGLIAGVAVFFRIVNLTFIGIPMLSWLVSLRWNTGMTVGRRFLFFYPGMAAGIVLILLMLHCQGLLDVFLLSMGDALGIFADRGDCHSMLTIVRSMYNLYESVGANALFLVLLCVLVRLANRQKNPSVRLLTLSVAAVLTFLMMNFSNYSSNITMALCLIGAVLLFFAGSGVATPSFAHLFIMSLYLPFILPVGSNAEAVFYGKELAFLTIPLSLYLVWAVTGAAPAGWKKSAGWMLSLVCVVFLVLNLGRKQMEDGNRIHSRYTIDSALTRGIHTTADNAAMYNHLISRLSHVVPKGSYMICSFSLPMVPVLDCKPWAVFSTYYSSDRMNERYIRIAWQHTHRLPYVLLDNQKDIPGYDHIISRLCMIRPYRKVWTDGRYELYYYR